MMLVTRRVMVRNMICGLLLGAFDICTYFPDTYSLFYYFNINMLLDEYIKRVTISLESGIWSSILPLGTLGHLFIL